MTEISASQVKELRDMTGAPMMDAKRALVETQGDLEKAAQLLREKGLAAAAKRAGRQVTEGRVIARIENTHGAIVAVGSETEPVSKNDEFLGFAERVIDAVEKEGPDAIAELETERVDLVARIGEHIEVVGASRFEAHDDEVLACSPGIGACLARRRFLSSRPTRRQRTPAAGPACTSMVTWERPATPARRAL